ncbi:MAG: RNA polymerase sigma factor [Acidimicrobiia bacterium]|nr:RNA polymerase sigma factor [Acidimicrobiia bacterium]
MGSGSGARGRGGRPARTRCDVVTGHAGQGGGPPRHRGALPAARAARAGVPAGAGRAGAGGPRLGRLRADDPGLPRFQGDTVALRSWVLVIAHRRAIDERRRLGRRRRIAEVVPLTEDAAGSGDVEREVLGRLERERVLEAIDELTDDQRSVVLLHSVGGLALSQVARLVGKHPGAVKSLHRRGLAAVARHLRRSEEVPHRRAAGEA